MFIEIHLLQSFAPSNLNRDDTGSPKDCEFGGVRRARISSQCLKRAMRTDPCFARATQVPLGLRTKLMVRELKMRLVAAGKPEESAVRLAARFVEAFISKLDTKNLLTIPTQTTNSNQIVSNYITVERAEVAGQNLKIYFNFNNTTNDILNISKLTDITFNIDNQQTNPTQMLDRQGQTFVQKNLSHTQNFGILVFPNPHATTGTLTFNQMFFEQTPDKILTQTIDIDLKQLEQSTKLRN